MSKGRWPCRPTPRRKSLLQIAAEWCKQRVKQWNWLQKQAVTLFVTYAEPSEQEKEATEERQG